MNDNDAGRRERALQDLRRWAESDQTARALEAMELLELTDEDVEALFRERSVVPRQRGNVVMLPIFGRVR